jgi:hypothetical protein
MNLRITSTSGHQLQEDEIVTKLKETIDARHLYTHRLNELLLVLARYLDENEGYERNQICRKIKEKLQDKIKERKITERWIEECLPQEYKRRYSKSEVSSVSSENKQGQISSLITQDAESYAVKEFDIEDHKPSADPPISKASQADADELQRCVNCFEISKNEVQFTIPRRKYENLNAAMEESNAAIYVVVKDGIFQYAFSDNV